jgi:putative component of toxin-antitoxin plasmid stabilization module
MDTEQISGPWELLLVDTSNFSKFVRSLSPVKQRTLEASIDKILLVHGFRLIDGDLIKNLGGGLYEYRVGPTSTRMMNKAGEGTKVTHQKIALRVFLAFEANRLIVLLGSYDKGANDSKSKQQSEITKARRLLKERQAR